MLATKGNLNNHLGVPFTLLRLTEEHDIAIIEMGANRFGDIEELCAIAEPNYGIITNVGKAHLEGFINFEGVLKTKTELYRALNARKGEIIVNIDDPDLMQKIPGSTSFITYGTHHAADINGELVKLSPFVELVWKHQDYISKLLSTRMIGEYNFYNYLAAIAFGVRFNVDYDAICAAIVAYEPENKRSQLKESASNTLILDCYNANPTSMRSALLSFAKNNTARQKLLIIGEMKELGNEAASEHKALLNLSEELGLKGYFVGGNFRNISSTAIEKYFESTENLLDYLKKNPVKDKMILLKGSRSVGLERCEEFL